MSSDRAVVEFGDQKLTKGDFEDHLALMSCLVRNKRPNLSEASLRKAMLKGLTHAKDELVSRLILASGLILTNTPAQLAACEEKLKKQYEKNFCAKGQTFDDLISVTEKDGCAKLFTERFKQDVRIQTAFETTYAARINLSEEEYSNSVRHVRAYNLMAEATNRLNWAMATNVLNRLAAGESFEKLADRYSQDPDKEAGGYLGECDLVSLKFGTSSNEEFARTPYWKAVKALKVGEYSTILENDTGLEIFKKIENVASTNSNSGLPAMRLSRIYFRRAYVYPEQNEADFRSDLKAEKHDDFMKAISKELQEKAQLRFPLGKKIFPAPKKKTPLGLPRQ